MGLNYLTEKNYKVKHIHINSETLTVSGVTIHQGFNKDYFLSEDYIDKFSDETLLLSRPPVRTGIPVRHSSVYSMC